MLVSFAVHGRPIPQGSVVAHVKGDRASIHYASGSGLAVWRNQVSAAAREAWGDTPYGGPFAVALSFVLKRPKSHYADLEGTVKARYRGARPSTMPDLDKLVRAILDALTGIVWQDDGQVVSVIAEKEYGDSPGVQIVVRADDGTTEYQGLEANDATHLDTRQRDMLALRG